MTQGTVARPSSRLATVSESGAAVLSSEDVRGSDVRDPAAEKIGTVEDLILDTVTGRVRFLRVGSGGLFGFGRSHRLIPVDAVTDVVQGAVFLDRSRERVEDAPLERVPLDDEGYITGVYAFYRVPAVLVGRVPAAGVDGTPVVGSAAGFAAATTPREAGFAAVEAWIAGVRPPSGDVPRGRPSPSRTTRRCPRDRRRLGRCCHRRS